MTDRRKTANAHLAAHAYMQLMFRLRVPVHAGTVVQFECTRCGGNHPLSQCRWPLTKRSEKESCLGRC